MNVLNDNYILSVLKKRNANDYKGNFGNLLIFAGSVGMAGAAVLCGKSSLKSGAGLVRFLVTSFQSPLYPILQISVPCATCIEYNPSLDFNQFDAIAIGPGLGRSEEVRSILTHILQTYDGCMVLDADALNIISESRTPLTSGTKILTPHIGEAKRLLHSSAPIVSDEERLKAFRELSSTYNSVVILKGHASIAGNTEEYYINTTGNPGMATAGSGDVLTGIVAALAAQGYDPVTAAALGTFIHGKAGDLAAEKIGEIGLTALDITDYIPNAFNSYYKELK